MTAPAPAEPQPTPAAPPNTGSGVSPVVWVLAAYGVAYAIYGMTLASRGPGFTLAADLAYLPFRMTATAMLALAGRVATHAAIRRGFTLLAVAQAFAVVGNLTWVYTDLTGLDVDDLGYLAWTLPYGVCMVAGLLTMIRAGGSRRDGSSDWLDAAIMITAASIVSWYFLAAQIAAEEISDLSSGAVFFLDSASNISVTMLAVTLWLRSPGGLARAAALRLWAALGMLAATDLLFELEMVRSTYIKGSPIDFVYAIAVIGIVAAADAQIRNPDGDPQRERARTGRSDFVVFVSAGIALVPLVVESARSDPLTHPMAVTAFGVTILMVLGLWRQRMARRAIGRLVANRLQLEHQLWQAQKQDAIGRLAGGIAHDFNNILAGISAHAQLVRVGAAPDTAAEARAIEFATQRAAVLVRRLLTFSRDASPEQRPVVLGDVVRSMQPMLRQLVVAEVALTFDVNDERAVVRLAEGQLEQILLNLAINARDAIAIGGQIGVTTRRQAVEPGDDWDARGVTPGVWAVLEVRDNGTGMDAATQARLFEPFFTTKDQAGGTGIGLATVHGIVDAAGGRIAVDSAPAHGTTMTVFLPLAPDAAPGEAAREGASVGVRHPATILVVDDEVLLRGAITRYLARLGYRVLEASDAEQAELALQRAEWRVDLMVTDVQMHGVSGPELARRLRQRLPALPVLYITGHADLPEGTPPGDLLQKPFDLETFAQYVDARLSTPARQ